MECLFRDPLKMHFTFKTTSQKWVVIEKRLYILWKEINNSFHVTLIMLALQKLYNILKRFAPVSTSWYMSYVKKRIYIQNFSFNFIFFWGGESEVTTSMYF